VECVSPGSSGIFSVEFRRAKWGARWVCWGLSGCLRAPKCRTLLGFGPHFRNMSVGQTVLQWGIFHASARALDLGRLIKGAWNETA